MAELQGALGVGLEVDEHDREVAVAQGVARQVDLRVGGDLVLAAKEKVLELLSRCRL